MNTTFTTLDHIFLHEKCIQQLTSPTPEASLTIATSIVYRIHTVSTDAILADGARDTNFYDKHMEKINKKIIKSNK